jgi:hypothetical protein
MSRWVAVGWDVNGVKYYFKSDGSQVTELTEATFFDEPGPAVMLANDVREKSWGKIRYPGEGEPPKPPSVVKTAHEEVTQPTAE